MDEQREVVVADEQIYNLIDYLTDHPFLFMGFGVGSGLLIVCTGIGMLLDNKFTNKGDR